jgi:hypothetical protein
VQSTLIGRYEGLFWKITVNISTQHRVTSRETFLDAARRAGGDKFTLLWQEICSSTVQGKTLNFRWMTSWYAIKLRDSYHGVRNNLSYTMYRLYSLIEILQVPSEPIQSHALRSNQLPQIAKQEIKSATLPAVIFKNSTPTPKTNCTPTTIF